MTTRNRIRTRLIVLFALSVMTTACGCSRGCSRRAGGADRSDGKIPVLTAAAAGKGAIRIDGVLDEPVWKKTGSTGPFVRPGDGRADARSPVNARARIAWGPTALYVGVVVRDRAPTSPFSRDAVDPHIWTRSSAIEVMIQPGDPGDNRNYFEIQVDVNGAVWDTRFDDYNRPLVRRQGRTRYGHQEWSSGVRRSIRVDRKAGTYTIELAMPWTAFTVGSSTSSTPAIPPKPGDIWRINLYSFRDGQKAAMAWSPILRQGNFHKATRFGRVTFAK
jgi:hypothetical protein